MKKHKGKNRIKIGMLMLAVLLMSACTSVQRDEASTVATMEFEAETQTESTSEIEVETELEATEEPIEETIEEPVEETIEETIEETAEYGRPVGHQIHYTKGKETYGWTRYEYDDNGRKTMIIFVSPRGDEYWSPVFYDGNGHVIPETVGNWATMDENGLHFQVGSEDAKGRRTLMAEYAYDERGNLTAYSYMYVNGGFQRQVRYTYDSMDRMVREETYYVRSNTMLSYVEYIYSGDGFLIRKNEVEDAKKNDQIHYTLYQYDEEGRLSREEEIGGGMVHDYVEYHYSDEGVLLEEYHYLEDPMMGGAYTVEYLFTLPDDSAG